jgi:dihydrofolate synthase/folylpolyglutamate synthase
LPGSIQVANAATALAALAALPDRLPLSEAAICSGLLAVRLAGRFQCVADPRGFEWVLDVAHNPAAAATLAQNLVETPAAGRTLAVCGMLGDKDVAGVIAELRGSFDHWYAASAEGPRAIDAAELVQRATAAGIAMERCGTVPDAIRRAAGDARAGDRIVVFGSFHTVGPALAALGVTL